MAPSPAAPTDGCAPTAPGEEPAEATALYLTLLDWTAQRLGPRGYGRPACKRLALLVTGLLAGERASVAGLAET